jgi:hypothetical protein
MQIRDKSLALIREFEGFQPVVCKDSAGLPLRYIGNKLQQGELIPDEITEDQAMDLLRSDAPRLEREGDHCRELQQSAVAVSSARILGHSGWPGDLLRGPTIDDYPAVPLPDEAIVSPV